MNKTKVFSKIAYWAGYCLFAGYSAYMTAKSVAMSFDLKNVWIVFVFVFVVALIAGYCLSMVVSELGNRYNPSRTKFVLGLLGFLLFWGVSFMTNVHYMLMSNEGLKVVSAELGTYKSFVERSVTDKKEDIADKEAADLALCEASIQNYVDEFKRECESSIRYGFGDRAIAYLKDIEDYLSNSGGKFSDQYNYKQSIFDDEKDRGDRGKRGAHEVKALQEKYSIRITEKLLRRENVIRQYYKRMVPQAREMELLKEFINDSLYVVDIPQITDISTPDVYYQFQKVQLTNNVFHRLDADDQIAVQRLMKESKTANDADIDKDKFRYRTYPSARMFSTFNVWDDMLHGRMPKDMRMLGWILFSLIIDIVAYVLRLLAR
jgi:hypothetical protein